ncbi:MAG: hypothetical protein F6K09_12810, partial [Merismopedia sp. SIO2A8]|nr:hypothetical protein [Merismopedia sp. SIO2A8]
WEQPLSSDSLQELFQGGDAEEANPLSEFGDPQSDEGLSGTVANLFSDLLADDTPSEVSSPYISPTPETSSSDTNRDGENTHGSEGEDDGLTPLSSTLDELFFNDSTPVESPSDAQAPLSDAQSIAKPLEGSTISDTFASFLDSSSESSPSESDRERDDMTGLEEDFGDNFEDDGLTSLLQDLQDNTPSPSQLSSTEDAKTLADLLRGQGTSRPPEPSSSSPDGVTTTFPPVPSDAQPFSNWFGESLEGPDEESDLEKKNNG